MLSKSISRVDNHGYLLRILSLMSKSLPPYCLLLAYLISQTRGLSQPFVRRDTTSVMTGSSTEQPTITHIYRYAVKGLSGDPLDSVRIENAGDSFPDDRRYALLYLKDAKDDESNATINVKTGTNVRNSDSLAQQESKTPAWKGQYLTKDHFLCAFTAPQLLAQYKSTYHYPPTESYRINLVEEEKSSRRTLSLVHRSTNQPVLPPDTDLATIAGRQMLADFLSDVSGRSLVCLDAMDAQENESTESSSTDISAKQQSKSTPPFQFGNTSSGVKHKGDTRTLHIVNVASVQDLQGRAGLASLRPERFRPNIVLQGLSAWEEFSWVGHTLLTSQGLRLRVISKTVRCQGVSVDPEDDQHVDPLDIPALLLQYFPEHGPYLGVYAVTESSGCVSVGDTITVIPETSNGERADTAV
jgi:uncharacterized protein